MSYSIKYKELFSVKILHRYFLDKGTDIFSSMIEIEQLKQLKNYDFQSFVNILPTRATSQKIKGYNLVFRKMNSGFTVWSKVDELDDERPFIDLEEDMYFTFLLKITNPFFYNYTDLNFESKSTGKPYYLSNRVLESEEDNFPLIGRAGGNNHINEEFIQSAEFDERDGFEKLSVNEKLDLFGLIRIYMKGDENSLSVTTPHNQLRVNPTEFEVIFKNRRTFWRYIFNQDQTVTASDDLKIENGNARHLLTTKQHPHTLRGFISIEIDGKELPNPDVRNIITDDLNNHYSLIYM